ncbi:alpha/beta fold hydrolase [Aquabacterium sp.]|uniref:alpha/beta fold hydrolase n=1 Tax=Aquabacterium sp. TaxID=1872578 RepID=UPI0037844D82
MPQADTLDDIEIHIEGASGEGAETLVMLHGWPDTWRLWDAQIPALAPHYRCVRLTLPGFAAGQPRRAVPLDDLVERLRRVIEHVSPGRPVILLLHDWGCLFGYPLVMRHPALVSRLIGVDVGDAVAPSYVRALSAREKGMVFGYQAWLALAWALRGWFGGRLADGMTRRMARWLRCPTEPAAIHAGMNYPYFITWTGAHGSYRGMRAIEPPCPMLYIHGLRKPVQFQSAAWLQALAARPGCAVAAMDSGHWMMVRQPGRFNEIVLGWLRPQGTADQRAG